jgi:hypothetical protein
VRIGQQLQQAAHAREKEAGFFFSTHAKNLHMDKRMYFVNQVH